MLYQVISDGQIVSQTTGGVSAHNDDAHLTTAKKNIASGIAGLDSSAKLIETQMPGLLNHYVIGNSVLHSHDQSLYAGSTSYVKLKTITLDTLTSSPQTLRIYYIFAPVSSGPIGYGKIYKNGVAFGAENNAPTTTPVEVFEDLAFSQGDTIEIWGKCSEVASVQFIGFKILGSVPQKTLVEAILSSDIGVSTPLNASNTTP